MQKILTNNKIILIGKAKDIFILLNKLSYKYTTITEIIEANSYGQYNK